MAISLTAFSIIINLIIAILLSWMVDTVSAGSGMSTFITYIIVMWIFSTYKGYSILVELISNRQEYLKQLDEKIKGDE